MSEKGSLLRPDHFEDFLMDTADDCMHNNFFSDFDGVFFPQLLRFVYLFGGAKILIQLEDVDTF